MLETVYFVWMALGSQIKRVCTNCLIKAADDDSPGIKIRSLIAPFKKVKLHFDNGINSLTSIAKRQRMKKKRTVGKQKSAVKKKTKSRRGRKPAGKLTTRKLQIIRLICQQLTSEEIGEKLGLSMKTVEVHKGDIFRRIKAKNIVGIVIYAIRHGIYKIR